MRISTAPPSGRSRTIPQLEPLEDRTLLSSGTVLNPPSTLQASLSLAVDGAYLTTYNLLIGFVTNSGLNPGALDEFGFMPSVTSDASTRAAAAGYNLGALQTVNAFLGSILTSQGVAIPQGAATDAQFNWSHAGPFAPFAFQTGVDAALKAVR